MASTIQYTVNPKEIDSSSNETDLDQYTASSSYTVKRSYIAEVADADKYITLPTSDNHLVIELTSDQNVELAIYDATGTLKIQLTDSKNVFMIFGAVQNRTYKLKNTSGSTANVVWRQYA